MATCRDVCTSALQALKALAPGDAMTVDEGLAALDALQQILLEWHAGRGPLADVDISADYTAASNQRVRVQAGATVTVTLPNSNSILCSWDPYDYSFVFQSVQATSGSIASADGYTLRQPKDGDRIEIVGLSGQALYFYCADTNTWAPVYGLTLDSALPVNARDIANWGARVAERLIDAWPQLFEPTPNLAKRIMRANAALLMRPGVSRDPVRGEYF